MKVFLDMDGVLVNFRQGICKAFGQDPGPGWSFWESWDGVTFEDVNVICDINFWIHLDWTAEGPEIEEAVRKKFDDVYLLTTPMPNSYSWTGKLCWIKANMPWMHKKTILSYAPKSLLAGPDTLLIDDKDQNVEEFRAAGGRGILVPRPWNKDSHLADQTLGIVKRYLEDY